VATALATQKMEEVRNLPYNSVGTVGGIPIGSLLQEEIVPVNGQNYTVKFNVVYIDDPFDKLAPLDTVNADYKRVKVSVTWTGPFPSINPVTMITDVMPKGIESDAGGGTLQVNVINALGQAVPNATVNVVNTTVVPNINLQTLTDNNGLVTLPGAPACNDCYRVTATKSGYSTDRTYGTTEVTNPLKPHAGVLEDNVTALTLAIDQLASMGVTVTGSSEYNFPPLSGVQFTLIGSKLIGTDATDSGVLKFQRNYVSMGGGFVNISGLEWDIYNVSVPQGASVEFAGSNPISPISMLPGQNLGVKIVVTGATSNSLLVTIKDINNSPVATASAQITGPNDFIATKSAGLSVNGDYGQAFFPNLISGHYDLKVTQVGFQEATSSTEVDGNVTESLILQPAN
jgi:hypothetical protein